MVGAAGGDAPGQIQALVGPSKQRDPAVGGDDASGEVCLDGPQREAFGRLLTQDRPDTPRNALGRSLDGNKSLYVNDLDGTSLPPSSRTMRYAG